MKVLKKTAKVGLIIPAGLFVLSLVLQLLFMLSPHGVVMTPDGALYSNIAAHLLHGEGFIQDARSYPIVVPPLYPLLLAAAYAIFGIENIIAVLVIQAILGALTTLLIYKMAKELFNRWVGLFAGVLFSAYSVAIYHAGFVLTETLFTFLVALLAYSFARLLRPQATYWVAGLAGLVWGLTCLARPHFLFFIPFLWLILGVVLKRRGIELAGIATLLLLITIAPWIGYLYVEHDSFISIASHGGIALWCGNGPFVNPDRYYNSTLYAGDPLFVDQLAEGMSLPLVEQDQFFRNTALQFAFTHPLTSIDNTWRKFILFWKPVNLHIRVFGVSVLDRLINVTDKWLLILFLPGLLLSVSPKWHFKQNQILLWLILYYSVGASLGIVVSQGRYRLPIMSLVAIYGGLAVWGLVHGLIRGIGATSNMAKKYQRDRR